MLPKESAFVSFPGHLSLYLLLQHVFIPCFYVPKTCNYLGTLKKKIKKKILNPFALLLAAFWGTSLMDIPSERNMRFKRRAMGNYQKYLFFYKGRRKSCVLPIAASLKANKSPSSSSRHSVAADFWDYLKHILNQEKFYLLQASKKSTNLSPRRTLSIAFDLKTHTVSL